MRFAVGKWKEKMTLLGLENTSILKNTLSNTLEKWKKEDKKEPRDGVLAVVARTKYEVVIVKEVSYVNDLTPKYLEF